MIQKLVSCKFENLELVHVRMHFSQGMHEIGRLKFGKILKLLSTIWRVLWAIFRSRPDILYYPPSGFEKMAFFRDAAILIVARPFVGKSVFHYHAAGLDVLLDELPKALKAISRIAFSKPDVAIWLSHEGKFRNSFLLGKKNFIIPNGLEDYSASIDSQHKTKNLILYIGTVSDKKGVYDLLEAAVMLKKQGVSFKLELMGEFYSELDQERCWHFLNQHNLYDEVEFVGVFEEQRKQEKIAEASILCHPSYFETFGLCVLEAMRAGKPVVVTDWPGVEELVRQDVDGYIVPRGDVEAMADRLNFLVSNNEHGVRLGQSGRDRFKSNYTLSRWKNDMEEAILSTYSDA